MKKAILILSIFLIPLVFAIDIYMTQEQLDALNTTTYTWQTLLCTSDGVIRYREAYFYTNYNCTDVEYLEEENLYHFYTGEFNAGVGLREAFSCMRFYNYTHCEEWYWEMVVRQAMFNVDRILLDIEGYQTHEPYNWSGDLFD